MNRAVEALAFAAMLGMVVALPLYVLLKLAGIA